MPAVSESRKRETKKEKLLRQHQDWWEVMSKQVDENLARHQRSVKRNGGRST